MRQVFLNLHNKPECPLLRRSLIFWLIDNRLIVIPSMRNTNLFQINKLPKVQNIILQNISLCKSLQECMYTGPRFTILPETTILKQLKSVMYVCFCPQWRSNRGFRRFIEPGPPTIKEPLRVPKFWGNESVCWLPKTSCHASTQQISQQSKHQKTIKRLVETCSSYMYPWK